MVDIVSPAKRSEMMSGIKGKDTKPEMAIRKSLFKMGFRYRLHYKKLPGKPDLVFPKYRAVIFVNGCFWHGHDCYLFRLPKTRPEFWKAKIESNIFRDKKVREKLKETNWRVLDIWECAVRGKSRLPEKVLIQKVASWILGDVVYKSIAGVTQ